MKAVLLFTSGDIQDAGQIGSIEGDAHWMRALFSRKDTDAVLLVDATNGFDSLKGKWHSATYNTFAHLSLSHSSTPIEKPPELIVDG